MTIKDTDGFPLSDDERMIRQAVRQFAESRVLPLAAEIDREHRFPVELVPQIAELGLFGAVIPTQYGGSELSSVAYAIAVEELAACCASTSIIVSAHNSLCCSPIVNFGTEEQKAKWLPDLASGKSLGCFALSEPGSGSDAAALTCRATKVDGGYKVNGSKNWITNGPVADVCVLFATEDTALGHKGVTAFVHSTKLPGFTMGKKEDKLGIRASPTSGSTYEDVFISDDAVLLGSKQGFKVAMETLNGGRIGVAAQAVGIARAALRDALTYSKERKTFGVPICSHQSIQNYLADMATGIDASRLLFLAASALKDQGKPYVRQAAQAKLFASETAMNAAIKGVQIHGGYGYVTDYPAERHLRDAKITEIYEGTSEIQRLVIAGTVVKES
jgi:butyryl-CoA dehydrogenase